MPRPKRMGGWVWRGKNAKTWMITYPIPGRSKPVTESAKTTDKAEAYKVLRKKVREVEEGRIVVGADKVTFDQMKELLYRDYRINGKRSLPDAKRRVENHLSRMFAGRTMHSIRRSDITQYIDMRQEERRAAEQQAAAAGRVVKQLGGSNATINRELACLKRMFHLGIGEELITRMPAFPPKLEEAPPRSGFFNEDMFQTVLAKLPPELRPVMTFAFWTGWRIRKEILSLEWKQVDLDEASIFLRADQSKNRQPRPIFLPPTLLALLQAQWAERQALYPECPFVFHRDGKRIRSYRDAWNRACKAAGVSDKLVHDLRRTAVRNLVRAGVSEEVAMKITGHKTRSVFSRYNITSETDLREAAQRLENRSRSDAPSAGTPSDRDYLSSSLSSPPGKGDDDPVTH